MPSSRRDWLRGDEFEIGLRRSGDCFRAAEAELRQHGYAEPERLVEIVHVALEDSLDELDEALD